VVIFTGVSKEDITDVSNPPPTAAGPFTIAGNNRLFSMFLTVLRRALCLEIMHELGKNHPDRIFYSFFTMRVYAFPDPTDEAQRDMILSLGIFV
jgi:hypothetical protein